MGYTSAPNVTASSRITISGKKNSGPQIKKTDITNASANWSIRNRQVRLGRSAPYLLLLIGTVLNFGACVGPHYCDHQIVGAKPCAIPRLSDAAYCLSKVP